MGHATTNQQNYLDLGYTDSVTQTRAGLIGISIVPAAKSIQIGKQATKFLVENKWGFFGHSGTESSVANNSVNHISALRLQKQLAQEEVSAIFNSKGELSQAAIENSRRMPLKINNTELKQILSERPGNLADWGKYETTPIHTDAGLARMHFYHNPVTGDLYYGMDYKAVFDHQGTWNLALDPNFNYEPPRFNP